MYISLSLAKDDIVTMIGKSGRKHDQENRRVFKYHLLDLEALWFVVQLGHTNKFHVHSANYKCSLTFQLHVSSEKNSQSQ